MERDGDEVVLPSCFSASGVAGKSGSELLRENQLSDQTIQTQPREHVVQRRLQINWIFETKDSVFEKSQKMQLFPYFDKDISKSFFVKTIMNCYQNWLFLKLLISQIH